ncbi:MAG: hypothetical protein WC453_03065 [Patescibacteria group bacterium]
MKFKLIVLFFYLTALMIFHSWCMWKFQLIGFCFPYEVQGGDLNIIGSWFAALIFFFIALALINRPAKTWQITGWQISKNLKSDALVISTLVLIDYILHYLLPDNGNRRIMMLVITISLLIMTYHFILSTVNSLAWGMDLKKRTVKITKS